MRKGLKRSVVLLLGLLLTSCGAPNSETPVSRRDRRMKDFGKIFGEEIFIFGGPKKAGDSTSPGMSVNPLLWRATLDSLSFMPLASADSAGGVIVTDWHQSKENSRERYKVTVRILSRQLRADALQVRIFKQSQIQGGWKDVETQSSLSTGLEDIILTRARQLRMQEKAA